MIGEFAKSIVKEQLKEILQDLEQGGKQFKIVIEIESEDLDKNEP